MQALFEVRKGLCNLVNHGVHVTAIFTGGQAQLQVFKRTQRCAATDVDPKTAQRRGDLPGDLSAALGHSDLGVYATVKNGGRIALGDQFSPGS